MITGRCECGKVRYQIDGEINDYSHCHCSQCRRLHGAAFATFAGVARKDFSYLSGVEDVASYTSSPSHQRKFCRHCGSNIMADFDEITDTVYVAMGTMDGDPPHPEGYHIYVGSKAPWHTIEDSLKQYDTEPEDTP